MIPNIMLPSLLNHKIYFNVRASCWSFFTLKGTNVYKPDEHSLVNVFIVFLSRTMNVLRLSRKTETRFSQDKPVYQNEPARYTHYNKHNLNESTRTINLPRTFSITHPEINVQIYTISI